MVTPELRAYVQKRREEGASQEEITQMLTAAGWQEQDIKEALGSEPSKKRARPLSILIASLIGILVLAGGVFAFWYFAKDPSPEEVMARMMKNIAEVKSLAYSGGIRIEVGKESLEDNTLFDLGGIAGFLDTGDLSVTHPPSLPSEAQNIIVSIDFSGASDGYDPKNSKALVTLDMRLDFSPEGKFAFGFETRFIDNVVYAKLARFEMDPALPFLDGITPSFKDQWFKIDQETLNKLNTYDQGFKANSDLSEEEFARLQEALKNAQIVRITETLPKSTLDGIKAFHYKFVLNKEGLRAYLVEIINIAQTKNLSREELRELKQVLESGEFDTVLDVLVKGFTGEIWIGKKDFLPHRASAKLTFKEEKSQKEAAKMSILVNMKDFNKPVAVEAPAHAKPLEMLVEEVFGASILDESRDLAFCAHASFICEEGFSPFNDETGCGCEPN